MENTGGQFIVAVCGLLVLSATNPQASAQREHRCGSVTDVVKSALVLPVPNQSGEAVLVTLHGRSVPALYTTKGLDQFWYFDDAIYIELRPNSRAFYWDFDGAEPEELRKPKSVFFCE